VEDPSFKPLAGQLGEEAFNSIEHEHEVGVK
jgi:hypothetical protein